MAEVKNFHGVLVFTDSVVCKNGAVFQFPDSRALSDCPAHMRKPAKQIHMVEQGITKMTSGLTVVLGNITDDFREVV
jgi:hypothetical protein